MAQNSFQTYLIMFMLGGTPSKTIEDFVIPFEIKDKAKENLSVTGKTLTEEAQTARNAWQGVLSLHGKGREVPQKKAVDPATIPKQKKRDR